MDDRRLKILGMDEMQFREFVDDALRAGSTQFKDHQQLMVEQSEALAKNTALTQQVANSTAEIVSLFGTSKKGLHFFQAFGSFLNRAARWLTPILIAGGAIWAIVHGHPPRGGE